MQGKTWKGEASKPPFSHLIKNSPPKILLQWEAKIKKDWEAYYSCNIYDRDSNVFFNNENPSNAPIFPIFLMHSSNQTNLPVWKRCTSIFNTSHSIPHMIPICYCYIYNISNYIYPPYTSVSCSFYLPRYSCIFGIPFPGNAWVPTPFSKPSRARVASSSVLRPKPHRPSQKNVPFTVMLVTSQGMLVTSQGCSPEKGTTFLKKKGHVSSSKQQFLGKILICQF